MLCMQHRGLGFAEGCRAKSLASDHPLFNRDPLWLNHNGEDQQVIILFDEQGCMPCCGCSKKRQARIII